mmetsp:Transcript_3836/g.5066  ORF Transcript_3836/g.5066 Transcript_3836/m.5066 type:complete len:106 (+) Transcript_3836:421-738(+)
MAYGHYNGKFIADPEIREMFTREELISSDWYQKRLLTKQLRDIEHWEKSTKILEDFVQKPGYSLEVNRLQIAERIETARKQLEWAKNPKYLDAINGTIGADPIHS